MSLVLGWFFAKLQRWALFHGGWNWTNIVRFTGFSSSFTSLPPLSSLLLLSSRLLIHLLHTALPRQWLHAPVMSFSPHRAEGWLCSLLKDSRKFPSEKTPRKSTLCGLITVYKVVFSILMRTMWVWKWNNSNLNQSCYLGVGSGLKLEIVLDHVIDNFCFRLSLWRLISIDMFVCFCLYDNHTNIKWFDQESRCSLAKVIVSLEVQAIFNKSVFSLIRADRKRARAKSKDLFMFVTSPNPFSRGPYHLLVIMPRPNIFQPQMNYKKWKKKRLEHFHVNLSVCGWQTFSKQTEKAGHKAFNTLTFFYSSKV